MAANPRGLALWAAALSFLLCIAGGLWILTSVGFKHDGDDAVWTGLGLYFMGKAFFVGPMLLLAAARPERR